MDYLAETLYRFCNNPDMYSFFLQNRPAYMWIAKNWIENQYACVNRNTFCALLVFLQKRSSCPASIDALIDYVVCNPDSIRAFERMEAIGSELRSLKTEYEPDSGLDDTVLFATLLNEARARWLSSKCKLTTGIAIGSWCPDKATEETGPTAAIQWLRTELTKDFRSEAPAVAGMLHENIVIVKDNLDSKLVSLETAGKFPLGFPHIDSCVTVGKQNLKFVGVVGMSGDGKTTLTNHIVYNWISIGAHVLYISTEHTPSEIWEFMGFLHQLHPDYDFTLPPMQDWEDGLKTGKVTMQDRKNMHRVLDDIQNRKNIPGLLDVQTMRDWEAIKDYLTINHKKNKYDILVVDYLGRLDVPGDQKFRDKAVAAMVTDAQKLTQEFDNKKGIILLTPIQVNREGNKRAKNAEEGEARYDLNAISTISEYQHHLDLCLSVFSSEEMKFENEVEVQVIKKRKGRQPRPETMTINPNSGAFRYTVAPQVPQTWERTAEEMAVSTTEISNENWGI